MACCTCSRTDASCGAQRASLTACARAWASGERHGRPCDDTRALAQLGVHGQAAASANVAVQQTRLARPLPQKLRQRPSRTPRKPTREPVGLCPPCAARKAPNGDSLLPLCRSHGFVLQQASEARAEACAWSAAIAAPPVPPPIPARRVWPRPIALPPPAAARNASVWPRPRVPGPRHAFWLASVWPRRVFSWWPPPRSLFIRRRSATTPPFPRTEGASA